MSDRIYDPSELPYYLSAKDISALLGLGLTKTYEIIHHKDCPKLIIGQRYVIPRDRFLTWLEDKDTHLD